MQYPVVIHKDKNSDYGVTVPDLPGCFSAGSTVDEAMAMVKEAIELYLEHTIEEGKTVPTPSTVEQHKGKRPYLGGTWALVPIDRSSLRLKSKRVNITMPERVLDAVDRFAEREGKTRSGLLAEAVSEFIETKDG